MNHLSNIINHWGGSIRPSIINNHSTIGIYSPSGHGSNDSHWQTWIFTRALKPKQYFTIQPFTYPESEQLRFTNTTKIAINISDEQVLRFALDIEHQDMGLINMKNREQRAYILLEASKRLGIPIDAICYDYIVSEDNPNQIQVYALPAEIADQRIQRITANPLQIKPSNIKAIIPDSIATAVYNNIYNNTTDNLATKISVGSALSFYQ